jgi:hypothetical protein
MTSSDDTTIDPEAVNRLRARAGEFLEPSTSGRGLRIALACGQFNGAISTRLLEGALAALKRRASIAPTSR